MALEGGLFGNRILVHDDVVSTTLTNGITSASATVSFSRNSTVNSSALNFGGLNITTSSLYSVYTEFSFFIAVVPIDDYTRTDINRQVTYIRNIIKVY